MGGGISVGILGSEDTVCSIAMMVQSFWISSGCFGTMECVIILTIPCNKNEKFLMINLYNKMIP